MHHTHKHRLTTITFLLICAALTAWLASSDAAAGGHRQAKPREPVNFDPGLRSDATGTVLVTGANRGIGLAMVKNYASRGWTVIATARKPEQADELNALAAANDNVTVERMDLLDHAGIDALAAKLRDVPIDVLLNNAAILGDADSQDFGDYDYDLMARVFAVNVAGTMKMTEAFIDHVAASEQKKVVAITSTQGSITALRDPLIPFYKLSKTALNMGMSSIAKNVKRRKITVALVSPGAVDTRMMDAALGHAGMKKTPGFLITPAESAEAVINVIDQYELKHTGVFMAHTGEMLPW
jgi:NAD(P)-dependent dehydrogenase (short-subunit alcohol dehydrogenase family)